MARATRNPWRNTLNVLAFSAQPADPAADDEPAPPPLLVAWQALRDFRYLVLDDDELIQDVFQLKFCAERVYAYQALHGTPSQLLLQEWREALIRMYAYQCAPLSAYDHAQLTEVIRLAVGFNALAWL